MVRAQPSPNNVRSSPLRVMVNSKRTPGLPAGGSGFDARHLPKGAISGVGNLEQRHQASKSGEHARLERGHLARNIFAPGVRRPRRHRDQALLGLDRGQTQLIRRKPSWVQSSNGSAGANKAILFRAHPGTLTTGDRPVYSPSMWTDAKWAML